MSLCQHIKKFLSESLIVLPSDLSLFLSHVASMDCSALCEVVIVPAVSPVVIVFVVSFDVTILIIIIHVLQEL